MVRHSGLYSSSTIIVYRMSSPTLFYHILHIKLVVYQVPSLKAPYHYANMVCLWRGAALPQKCHLGVYGPARLKCYARGVVYDIFVSIRTYRGF